MRVFRTLNDVKIGSSTCAIGMFDGLHVGHHLVLEHALRAAKINGDTSVVMTFANHPQSILSQTPTPLLSTLEERLTAFEAMGFEAALVLNFTPELRDYPAEYFVQHILLDTLHVQAVSVGYDHRFGKDRRGDTAFLQEQGQLHHFDVTIVDPVRVDDQIVSSTLIRKLLSFGQLQQANQLLGKPYSLTGKIMHGVGRGKTIGFPTANLTPEPERLVPASGVYAGHAWLENQSHPAVCNVGIAPTFGDQVQARVEIHVLDSQLDLYGQTLRFTFEHYLRPEQAFSTVEQLIQQINADCASARQWHQHLRAQ